MTHYVDTYPKARREHRCSDCGRTIRVGEKYRRGVGMDNGTAWTWKECLHCQAIVPLVVDGDFFEEGYGDDTFTAWEPSSVPHLRLKALWRKRWQRADGGLYPVPVQVFREDRTGWPHLVDVRMPEAGER